MCRYQWISPPNTQSNPTPQDDGLTPTPTPNLPNTKRTHVPSAGSGGGYRRAYRPPPPPPPVPHPCGGSRVDDAKGGRAGGGWWKRKRRPDEWKNGAGLPVGRRVSMDWVDFGGRRSFDGSNESIGTLLPMYILPHIQPPAPPPLSIPGNGTGGGSGAWWKGEAAGCWWWYPSDGPYRRRRRCCCWLVVVSGMGMVASLDRSLSALPCSLAACLPLLRAACSSATHAGYRPIAMIESAAPRCVWIDG